ncbi:ComEC/Rec2 family competence protein [Nocardioides alcanivorans]|uniref:ComEC/Rec2 family competence protein n=1 Tax=Nocardioides alcanivorans TaxID=2897352 RepID=UPI001F310F9C|nr:MBL fold metallo-hydrolase [Nocardioides alcanivorans]
MIVACDVGQGDGLALRSGPGEAVVFDAGPDARAMQRCLDRLGIERVPLLVITHFDADHADGLAGVLQGRQVGTVWVSARADPPSSADRVLALAGARAEVPTYAETRQIGDVTLQAVGPVPGAPITGPNDSSVVVLAEVRGVRILMTGDVEPAGQRLLAQSLAGLQVDVLKVPHHGSRHQVFDFLTGLGPKVALVSAGADNDYGHPAPETLEALTDAGVSVLRTDVDGDVAVVRRGGVLRAVR